MNEQKASLEPAPDTARLLHQQTLAINSLVQALQKQAHAIADLASAVTEMISTLADEAGASIDDATIDGWKTFLDGSPSE